MSTRLLTWILLLISAGMIIYFIGSLWFDGMRIWGSEKIEYEKTGQVGDFIGGVIGTLINAAAFYFLYLTLQEQRIVSNAQRTAIFDQKNAFEKERLETDFFEMLKLHRDNVGELKKDAFENNTTKTHEARKVIQLIVSDILICREEIKAFYRMKTEANIYVPEFARKLKAAFKYSNPNVDLIKLAKVNIPYCIVFFGVDAEGRRILESLFEGRYNPKFYKPILDYISLKPIKDHIYHSNWEGIKSISDSQKRIRVALGTRIRRRTNYNPTMFNPEEAALIESLWYRNEFTKYYGGNQFRLGHYFRHLYQMVKFIDKQKTLTKKEKYFYVKTLRAQLSTHEQVLLFLNSLSFMGMVWELTPKFKPGATENETKLKAKEKMLITKYQFIKNIPRKDIFGFNIPDFYPDIKLESMQLLA